MEVCRRTGQRVAYQCLMPDRQDGRRPACPGRAVSGGLSKDFWFASLPTSQHTDAPAFPPPFSPESPADNSALHQRP